MGSNEKNIIKMKTAEEREIPTNSECPLTDEEMNVLLKYLHQREWATYQRYVQKLTSGYCDSEVQYYDEFEITILFEWGVDGQWRDDDQVCLDRKVLSTPEKILS